MEIVEKPWGREIIWARTEKYVGKILEIKKSHALSKQYHVVKDETVMILEGSMELQIGDPAKSFVLFANDSRRIHPNTIHRMVALEDCRILEVSTPELDDVVRLEDRYGRVNT